MPEFIDHVTWDDLVLRSRPKSDLKEGQFPHRGAVVLPRTPNGKFILAKRAKDKHPFPDIWCCGIGGHVASGETYEEAALREMQEEAGISSSLEFLAVSQYDSPEEQILFHVFASQDHFSVEDFSPDPREIQYFKAFHLEEIEAMIAQDASLFSPTFVKIIEAVRKSL